MMILSDLIHTKIYLVETFNEVKRYIAIWMKLNVYCSSLIIRTLLNEVRRVLSGGLWLKLKMDICSLTLAKTTSVSQKEVLLDGQNGAGKHC